MVKIDTIYKLLENEKTTDETINLLNPMFDFIKELYLNKFHDNKEYNYLEDSKNNLIKLNNLALENKIGLIFDGIGDKENLEKQLKVFLLKLIEKDKYENTLLI